MAWCCQATSHYPIQCWPRSMLPNMASLGHNELKHQHNRGSNSGRLIQYRIRRLCKISQSLGRRECRCWNACIALKFGRCLGSSAAETCQISKQLENSNHQSHAFETLWDLTIRHLIRYWISPGIHLSLQCLDVLLECLLSYPGGVRPVQVIRTQVYPTIILCVNSSPSPQCYICAWICCIFACLMCVSMATIVNKLWPFDMDSDNCCRIT